MRRSPIRHPAMVVGVLAVAAMVVRILPAAAHTAVMAGEVSVGGLSGQTPRNRVRVAAAWRAA